MVEPILTTLTTVPKDLVFSCKEIALVLGLANETKATQATKFLFPKIGMFGNYDYERMSRRVLWEMERLRHVAPMSDQEIALRVAMLCGQVDRQVIHPHATTTLRA